MPHERPRILAIAFGALGAAAFVFFMLLPPIVAWSMNGRTQGPRGEASAEARRLHETLMVADLHGDALLWDRNLLRRVSRGHIDLPRLIEGRVGIQAFTVVTKFPAGANIDSNDAESDLVTPLVVAQAWPPRTWWSLAERALYQARKLERFEDRSDGRLTIVRTGAELDAFLRRRDSGASAVAGLLGLEGAHALEGDLANVERLFDAGFRVIGLAHFFDNEVGGSAHGVDKGGLTAFGVRVLDRMAELGIAVDLAHASPALIDDVLARTRRPVLVSHTGVKGTCDNARNLDDGRLAGVAATGGVVGIALFETAVCGDAPADWAAAVRHAAEVAGVDHVGLGSDWDGAVRAIVDAAETPHLTEALMNEGFEAAEIRRIMGGNVVRVLREVLPTGADAS